MSNYKLNIDTGAYAQASARATAAAQQLEQAIQKVMASADAAAGSAGPGAGDKFADEHDPKAAQTITNAGLLVDALYVAAANFRTCGYNYGSAEAASTGQDAPAAPEACAAPSSPGTPASIRGGSLNVPAWWHVIEDLVTDVWPSPDEGRLNALSDAWDDFNHALNSARGAATTDVLAPLAELTAPDIAGARSFITSLGNDIDAVAADAADLGHGIESFLTNVEKAHEECVHEADVVMVTLVSGAVISGLLTVVTAGISDAVDAAASGAEITTLALRIGSILNDLSELKYLKPVVEIADRLVGAAKYGKGAAGLFGRIGLGAVKGVGSGGLVWGPSNLLAQAATSDGHPLEAFAPSNILKVEGAAVAGGIVGEGVSGAVEGVGALGGSAASGSEHGAADAAGAADAPGAPDGVAPQATAHAPAAAAEDKPTGSNPDTGPRHAPEVVHVGQGYTIGGKVAGAASSTAVQGATTGDLDPKHLLVDTGKELAEGALTGGGEGGE